VFIFKTPLISFAILSSFSFVPFPIASYFFLISTVFLTLFDNPAFTSTHSFVFHTLLITSSPLQSTVSFYPLLIFIYLLVIVFPTLFQWLYVLSLIIWLLFAHLAALISSFVKFLIEPFVISFIAFITLILACYY